MSISDVIKSSFLEGFTTDITLGRIAVALGVTIALALYVFLIYRLASRSSFYSKDFNRALAAISVVTAGIVLAMQSNIVISLGMVGALSIVRFRNAVKSSLDLIFLFWSISVGIICGAGLYLVAILTSAAVTVLLFVLDLTGAPKAPYLLVVNSGKKDGEAALEAELARFAKHVAVKSRNMTAAGVNYVIELRTQKPAELLAACEALDGVNSASLLMHDGELRC